MKRVLFVDDESNILDGLRRMLRPLRHEWDMAFAESGQAALLAFENTPYDVIVSDMRMPGMDGVQLLTEVKQRYPDAIRIALSGHSEMEMLLECTRVAHQYLAKPCDPDTLKTTIDRASALQELLTNGELRKIVSQIDSLPSLPELYIEVMEELKSKDSSIGRVGAIISKDIGMTAKILQMVNSAFFGMPTHISSPAQAAMLLGIDVLRGLILSSKVFSQFDPGKSGLDLALIQRHSEQAGALARQIAITEGQHPKACDNALLAGMLQDVGRLVLAGYQPRKYIEVSNLMDEASIKDWQAEHEIFGCTHMEVGAYLLGIWGLSNQIIETIAYHHHPVKSVGTHFTPLTAVHVANVLLRERDMKTTGRQPIMDYNYLNRLGLAKRTLVWCELYADMLLNGGPGQ